MSGMDRLREPILLSKSDRQHLRRLRRLYSCIIILFARVKWILRCDMKIAAGYPHVVTVTCKWTHAKISFLCALRLHGTCTMSPVQTLCTVHAVHRPCFQTCLIRSRRRFLHPVIFSLILCGFFDVLMYLQTLSHLKAPLPFALTFL